MQPDLEQSVPMVSLQDIGEFERGISPIDEGRVLRDTQIRGQQGIRRRKKPSPALWRFSLMIGDSLLLLISLGLLLLLAPLFHMGIHISWGEPETWNWKLVWGSIALVSWNIAVGITQAQDLRSASNRFKSPLKVLYALIFMVIIWFVLIYPFIADRIAFSLVLMLLFLMVAAPILVIWRVILAEFMRLPRFRTQGIIIGITAAGEAIASEFRRLRRTSINLLGYISEYTDGNVQKASLPVLGGRNTLWYLMHNGLIDMIIMASDYKANPVLFQEAIEAAQLGVSVVPMSIAYERLSGKIPVEHIGDQWYLALPVEVVASPLYLCWRKVLDITVGLLGMVILILTLPILAPLIYLDSPGSIFYKQERLGCNGRKFSIYKFRSMCTNAEHARGALWASEDDSRVTRIGRFMRATHLDEFPQVLNILHGDMSLIGPRPEREVFVSELEKIIPFYRCRLMVKPGLSGWAQVKYGYGRTDQDALEKLQYDLYYIKHQSFTLDIYIILKTVAEVFLHRGT